MHRARGMTLIEMVLAVVIVAIVLAASAPIIGNTFQSYVTTRSALDATSKARLAVERIAREIREVNFAAGAYQFGTMTATDVTFTKTDGTVVRVDRAGANLRIRYTAPAPAIGPFVLTDDVTAGAANFRIDYLDATGALGATVATVAFVQITLTLDVPNILSAAHTERTRVALRDKS
jgi:prepilin-type N-terminal cleavage/methylation domain-containing protein